MPSAADLRRFDRDDISCPNCGTDVYHDAALCHACGHAMLRTGRGQGRLFPIVAALAAAGILLGFLGWLL